MVIEKMNLEKVQVQFFFNQYHKGFFQNQRLGQAFCDHFKLERCSSFEDYDKLYESTGTETVKLIEKNFNQT